MYEAASKLNTALTKGLVDIHDKLGQPQDCSVNTGWVMLDNIVQIWMKYYPQELAEWLTTMKEDLSAERTVHEAVKADGGYFPISYPMRLYQLIKALLPKQNLNDKDFIKHMVSRYPLLKSTNYRI